MVTTAANTSAKTTGLIPLIETFTAFDSLNLFIVKNIILIIIKLGSVTPSVATTLPKKPANLLPMKVAELTANGPGVVCAMATISIKSE